MTHPSPDVEFHRRLTLTELIERLALEHQQRMWTSLPGIVDTYDETTQKARIQPMVQGFLHKNTEHRRFEDEHVMPPPVSCCPVMFPQGTAPNGKRFAMHWSLKRGDFGLLIWAKWNISGFLQNGDQGRPCEQPNPRWFAGSDAIFVPMGPNPWKSALTSPAANPNAMLLGHDDGTTIISIQDDGTIRIKAAKVVVESNDVRLGSDGVTKKVALAEDVETELDRLWDVVTAHIHPTPSGPSSPPSAGAPVGYTGLESAGSVGASKVKAE